MNKIVALKKTQADTTEAMQQMFTRQQGAFGRDPYPDAARRIDLLHRLEKALVKHRKQIAAAIDADFGCRSADETDLAEILPSLEAIRYARRRIKKWMKPSRRHAGLLFQPASARVIYQPLGVVGIITPWNYPVFLSMGPLVGALAAGNRAMIKMSRSTPHTAEVVGEMIANTFDTDQVALVEGAPGLGSAFAKLPWDHLCFTGSTRVGRHVMRAAADNLTPVTLELGGKSPAIIGSQIPIDEAAGRIAFGKVFNMGQTCVAPDYVLCPHKSVESFVAAFTAAVSRMYSTMAANPQYTGIINDQEFARLQGLLADAVEKGAQVVEINPAGEDFSGVRKMPMRLVLDVNDTMDVMREEIFGPLLPIVTYTDLDEAIAYVNSRPRPLALYYFDYDRRQAHNVLHSTHSGGAVVNDTLVHVAQDDLPFGGVGDSGMGQYHAREGFLTFSKAKGVLTKGRFNSGKLIWPPYGRTVHRWIERLFLK